MGSLLPAPPPKNLCMNWSLQNVAILHTEVGATESINQEPEAMAHPILVVSLNTNLEEIFKKVKRT